MIGSKHKPLDPDFPGNEMKHGAVDSVRNRTQQQTYSGMRNKLE